MNAQQDRDQVLLPFMLSHFQARALREAWGRAEPATLASLDLGKSQVELTLSADGVGLPGGAVLPWQQINEILEAESFCFALLPDSLPSAHCKLDPVRGYSEALARTHQLFPTASAPALLLSGFTMHRFRGTTPERSAALMVRAVAPAQGRVLDTATGLGYAAIEAAKTATEVVTIELDPGAVDMARRNPWSQELFTLPNITRLHGDSSELINTFPDASFDRVVHDPPAINLAGELYSGSFYAAVHRVLTRKGRLFHYIGDPDSSSGGRVTKGVVRRLQEAGFSRVVPRAEAFGVVGYK